MSGYTHLEIGLYLRWLFGLKLVDYWLVVVLAIVVHVVVNHKYLGHFVMVLYYVFTIFAGQLGLEHNLLLFGADSGIRYSDMNGFGHFVGPYLWFKLYWALLAVALAIVANLLWVRGSETDWRTRRELAGRRFTGPARAALAGGAAGLRGRGQLDFLQHQRAQHLPRQQGPAAAHRGVRAEIRPLPPHAPAPHCGRGCAGRPVPGAAGGARAGPVLAAQQNEPAPRHRDSEPALQ